MSGLWPTVGTRDGAGLVREIGSRIPRRSLQPREAGGKRSAQACRDQARSPSTMRMTLSLVSLPLASSPLGFDMSDVQRPRDLGQLRSQGASVGPCHRRAAARLRGGCAGNAPYCHSRADCCRIRRWHSPVAAVALKARWRSGRLPVYRVPRYPPAEFIQRPEATALWPLGAVQLVAPSSVLDRIWTAQCGHRGPNQGRKRPYWLPMRHQ
jgi:hypothetical protein